MRLNGTIFKTNSYIKVVVDDQTVVFSDVSQEKYVTDVLSMYFIIRKNSVKRSDHETFSYLC